MSASALPVLDVIVRTLADAPRARLLLRALDSIQNQAGIRARPIVVVNGERTDPATLAALGARQGIVVHRIPQASAGLARAAGRQLVQAPYFAYLDDDDELIADALAAPVQWLAAHPECDVLVNNGFFVTADGQRREATHLAEHIPNPTEGLLRECWLSPGASLFRTASIGNDLLGAPWSHLEWTYLAFEMCARGKRVQILDVPTVLYHDTPGSMSKSTEQLEGELELWRTIRADKRLGRTVCNSAARKYLHALHNQAMIYWRHGDRRRAWRCHLASLQPPATFHYLLFSRKLLWPFGGAR